MAEGPRELAAGAAGATDGAGAAVVAGAAGAADEAGGLGAALRLVEAELGRAFPAAALGYGEGGRTQLLAACGAAGLDTWFDLASLTKALSTTLVALRLCAAGRLDLDEEARVEGDGAWALPGVRVLHLLCHASGLPAWQPLYDIVLRAGAADPAAARAALVGAAAAAERGPAGVASVYSDLGFILLGDLLERRGGAPLDAQLAPVYAALGAELAFRPLGRAGVGPAIPAEACAQTRRESPAREPLRGVVHDDNARALGGVAGHAGLFGTAAGVARLATALLCAYHGDPGALEVPAALLRRFFSPCGVPGSTWGLGWDHPAPGVGASSAGDRWPRDGVGHLGFTGCSLWLDPAARRFALLLSNRVDAATPAAAAEAQARMKALRPRLHDTLLARVC